MMSMSISGRLNFRVVVAFALLLTGVVYGVLLLREVGHLSGAGHGPLSSLIAISMPFGAAPVAWGVLFPFAFWFNDPAGKRIRHILVGYYALVCILILNDLDAWKSLHSEPAVLRLGIVFVCGQAILLGLLAITQRKDPPYEKGTGMAETTGRAADQKTERRMLCSHSLIRLKLDLTGGLLAKPTPDSSYPFYLPIRALMP